MNPVEELQQLVSRYKEHRAEYIRSGSKYNETELRSDFLNSLLELLGWDVFNRQQAPQYLREVIQEDIVTVEDTGSLFQKKPDYALRAEGERKFFVEAKKPSVNILEDAEAAFQTRRYGWSAKLPISVLTNFEHLVIYDCRPSPQADDHPSVARLHVFTFEEYIERFEEINDLISRQVVYSGRFDERFRVDELQVGTQSFDAYFLHQIETWRRDLSENLVQRDPQLTQPEINYLVQQLINRIIFLRICEDRRLETYQSLKNATSYDDLKKLFIRADERYDSGLFDFIEDTLSLNIQLDDGVLITIFRELYYPESPYAFAVVETRVLGGIYELFLSKEIVLDGSSIRIIDKPEVVASRGVVPTPQFIVDQIIERSLGRSLANLTLESMGDFRVADISCGSGTFLLAAYEALLNWYLDWYVHNSDTQRIYETIGGRWQLTLDEKKRILLQHIYGVDIDPQAVEVTRFSLLLKTLEDESPATIEAQIARRRKALPSLNDNIKVGNSLVDSTYFNFHLNAINNTEVFATVAPFDWQNEFSSILKSGGFDVIIGNPPYIRIQNMVQYSPDEVAYYQSAHAPFETKASSFDKYILFIERALELLKPGGKLGYIVTHKFLTIQSGKPLRKLLADGQCIEEIVHFGVQQVFAPHKATYTCILILHKADNPVFSVEHVDDLIAWKRGTQGTIQEYPASYLSAEAWELVSPQAYQLFERLRSVGSRVLKDVADIFVGVQTSADKIYIITPDNKTESTVVFTDLHGQMWEIEKAILRPCIYDLELPAFATPEANTYIIFPYEIVGKRAEVIPQAVMQSTYPRCWEYLKAHEAELRQRSINSFTEDTWYRYGRGQSLTRFNGEPKLLWAVLMIAPNYAYDDQNIVYTGGGNGPYYGLRPNTPDISIFFLQAILSNRLIDEMVKARSSEFRGGYRSHGKQFIEDIPLPIHDLAELANNPLYEQIIERTQLLIKATEQLKHETVPQRRRQLSTQIHHLRQQLDQAVFAMYNVTAEDIEAVPELNEATDDDE